MIDTYKIDSHKLSLHPERVSKWLCGEKIYPIYAEIGTSGRCNHRCIFCSFDYLKHSGSNIKSNELYNTMHQLSICGLKSVMLAGEGEPLLHQDIIPIIHITKCNHIDVAITTNGAMLSREIVDECLHDLSWIKISLDAPNPETHIKIHRCNVSDFDKIINNIKYAVDTNYRYMHMGYKSLCTIGIQMLLIPENKHLLLEMAKLSKSLGVDYLVVKPFTEHPMCDVKLSDTIGYDAIENEKEALSLSDDHFQIIIRKNTMHRVGTPKEYSECYGYKFWLYIASNGDVYSCSAFLGNKDFCYGNIYTQSINDIWNSKRYNDVINRMSQVDVSKCRDICRLDKINAYLWELKHPGPHVNFL